MGFVSGTPRRPERVPTLEDLPEPAGKSVLVRATFDRPLGAQGAGVLAHQRALGLARTLDWLLARGARVTVCGELGTTGADGEAVDPDAVDPDAVGPDAVGPDAVARLGEIRSAVEAASAGPAAGGGFRICQVAEHAAAVDRLVAGHHLFVNDTLQDSFLPLPSLTRPAERLPSAVGRTLEHDLAVLDRLLFDPPRPLVALLGGERSFERLHGLRGLVLRADVVLLGGALAGPVLQAVGRQPVVERGDDLLEECRAVAGLSRRVHHEIELPVDLVWRKGDGPVKTSPTSEIGGGGDVLDIGPRTAVRFAEVVASAGSILWAGSLGRVEEPVSAAGTRAVAADLAAHDVVALGGDALADTLAEAGLLSPSAELLSATDAAIEVLKNGDLPALAALRRA